MSEMTPNVKEILCVDMKINSPYIFILIFLFLAWHLSGQQRATPKSGEGISVLFCFRGTTAVLLQKKYHATFFTELNKKKLGKEYKPAGVTVSGLVKKSSNLPEYRG